MKKLIVIASFLLFSFSSYAEGVKKGVKGEMICKIKSNYVVEINEGKPEFYSGIKGSFAKGDSLVFNFFTESLINWATIELRYKDKLLGSFGFSISNRGELKPKDNGFDYQSGFDHQSLNFSDDWISFDLTGNGDFRIKRYYKGDWNGIIRGRYIPNYDTIGEKVATLDCRQSSDKVDEFIEYVREMAGNE